MQPCILNRRFGTVLTVIVTSAVFWGCSQSPEVKRDRFLSRGKAYFAKGEYDRAVIELRKAAQAAPQDAEVQYQLGLAYQGKGATVESVAALLRATQLNPKHVRAQVRVAELMSTSVRPEILDQASERIASVLAATPEDPDALHARALLDLRKGETDAAEADLDHALRVAPGDVKTAVALARIKLGRKDATAAEQVLLDAARRAPDSESVHIALGQLYMDLGRLADSQRELQTALRVQPRNAAAMVWLARLHVLRGDGEGADTVLRALSKLPDPRYRPAHAVYLVSSGRQEDGIAELRELMKEYPNDGNLRRLLVSVYVSLNRKTDAANLLDRALAARQDDTEALVQRAAMYIADMRLDEAENALSTVIRLQPNSAEARLGLARVYGRRQLPFNQRQQLEEALRLRPDFLGVRVELARVLLSMGDVKTALSVIAAAPPAQKDSLSLVAVRNWALLASGRSTEFEEAVTGSLKRAATPEFLVQRGTIQARTGKTPAAESSFQEALRLDPGEMRALEGLVRLHLSEKHPDKAIQVLRDHVAAHPGAAEAQKLLGDVLAARGRDDEARAAFNAAKSADPAFVSAYVALAAIEVRTKHNRAARAALTDALAISPNHVSTHLLFAFLEESEQNTAAAIEHYRTVLSVEPNHIAATNNLAYLLTESGMVDEALGYARRAKELSPDNPAVDHTLGWTYFRKQLYAQAVRHLEIAAMGHASAKRRYHLAMAYAKTGEQRKAEATFKGAWADDASLPEAAVAKQLLGM